MRNDRIEVRPLAGALGAEIVNVDLAEDLSEKTMAALRRAWLEHLVVFFRDQTLEPARFVQAARRFGDVTGIECAILQRRAKRRRLSLWETGIFVLAIPISFVVSATEQKSF